MKILHIWDIGGDSYLLAKYQRKLGHQSDVIKNYGFDPYGHISFYGGNEFKTRIWVGEFYFYCLWKSRNYDLIHVHYLYKLIPLLRKFFPKKKIILHYHGSDCRYTPLAKRKKAEKMADVVLLSTPDLKEFVPEGLYVPNPIDTEHFKKKTPISDKAFTLLPPNHTFDLIKNHLTANNIDIEFEAIDTKTSTIQYRDMPKVMSKYGLYIDLKFTINQTLINSLSNTGRQALAGGLKVLNYNLKFLQGLPLEYEPENVAKNLESIYN